jgi:hypothetical protein
MKKICPFIVVIIVVLLLTSCEKEKDSTNAIQIRTDNVIYSPNQKIIIEIINCSDSIALYFVCSSYQGIPPIIYKFENNTWNGYWGPICNGFSSFCCRELQSGASYKDTLILELEEGSYKIEYQFIVRPSHQYESFFSDPIKVK